MAVLHKELFVETLEHIVEAADHFSWEVDELIVDLPVVLLQVSPLHLEDASLQDLQLVELTAVDLFTDRLLPFNQFDLLEGEDEVLEGIDDVLAVYVGPVDDSDIVTG